MTTNAANCHTSSVTTTALTLSTPRTHTHTHTIVENVALSFLHQHYTLTNAYTYNKNILATIDMGRIPTGVPKSSTTFGWGKGWNVTSAV